MGIHDDGQNHREKRLVHWNFALKTAICDIDVNNIELDGPVMLEMPGGEEVEFGVIVSFAYKLVSVEERPDGELAVAMTRLETMLGDVAIAKHSNYKRYKHLIGSKPVHQFVTDRDVAVIARQRAGQDRFWNPRGECHTGPRPERIRLRPAPWAVGYQHA